MPKLKKTHKECSDVHRQRIDQGKALQQEQTRAEVVKHEVKADLAWVKMKRSGRQMEPVLWAGNQQAVYQDTRSREVAEELGRCKARADEGVTG